MRQRERERESIPYPSAAVEELFENGAEQRDKGRMQQGGGGAFATAESKDHRVGE